MAMTAASTSGAARFFSSGLRKINDAARNEWSPIVDSDRDRARVLQKSLFAERNGVDLIKVIQAIKVRPTHSNMIFPGPGIGGYCLPKDGGLGYWAYKHILGFEDGDQVFKMSTTAIDINDTRGLEQGFTVRAPATGKQAGENCEDRCRPGNSGSLRQDSKQFGQRRCVLLESACCLDEFRNVSAGLLE